VNCKQQEMILAQGCIGLCVRRKRTGARRCHVCRSLPEWLSLEPIRRASVCQGPYERRHCDRSRKSVSASSAAGQVGPMITKSLLRLVGKPGWHSLMEASCRIGSKESWAGIRRNLTSFHGADDTVPVKVLPMQVNPARRQPEPASLEPVPAPLPGSAVAQMVLQNPADQVRRRHRATV